MVIESGADLLTEDDDLVEEEDDTAVIAAMRPGDPLALRRAIELRQEQRRLEADLNYLEYDLDD